MVVPRFSPPMVAARNRFNSKSHKTVKSDNEAINFGSGQCEVISGSGQCKSVSNVAADCAHIGPGRVQDFAANGGFTYVSNSSGALDDAEGHVIKPGIGGKETLHQAFPQRGGGSRERTVWYPISVLSKGGGSRARRPKD